MITKNNMIPKFTPEQKIENLKLAIKALRENPIKAKHKMSDEFGGRCCLCVIAHVAEDICGVKRNTFCDFLTPNVNLNEIFPFNNHFIRIGDNILLKGEYASNWNDGSNVEEKTHAEIADMIEEEFLVKTTIS